jgi:indole-3-acetate O-methyltransferase
MDVIIKHITKRYEALGFNPPEFSAFFSDLPSNDFNTLFQLLPPLANYGVSMEECLAANNHRSYFAAGVPGSFYRRLFPARSVDFFHSAFSLHWLSQVIYQFLLIYQHHSFFFLYLLLMYFYLKFYFIRKKVHE